MGILQSIEIAVWVAVGGRGTLAGPALGAILVNAAKSGLSESFPVIWQFFLGALFISAVLLFPGGIMGFFRGEFGLSTLTRGFGRLRARLLAMKQQGIGGVVRQWTTTSFPWKV